MTTMIRCCLLVVPVSILLAIVMSVSFPKATSNASSGQDDSPDAAIQRSFEAIPSSQLCPIDWRQSAWHVKQLIRCAASHYGVSPQKALHIAWRESRFQPDAYNAAGRAAGLYQHLLKYWPERAQDFGFRNWSVFDARANIMVTMRMVRRFGWAPWGG